MEIPGVNEGPDAIAVKVPNGTYMVQMKVLKAAFDSQQAP
jgi:hypothetical protein